LVFDKVFKNLKEKGFTPTFNATITDNQAVRLNEKNNVVGNLWNHPTIE
jgi:hypothetical protein